MRGPQQPERVWRPERGRRRRHRAGLPRRAPRRRRPRRLHMEEDVRFRALVFAGEGG